MRIYGYDDEPKEVELKDKDIAYILVTILTGDEIVTVFYEDGDIEMFDSGVCRLQDFHDGSYIVRTEDVERWMHFKNNTRRCMSYARRDEFSGEEDLWQNE